jgi:hypothetical protein
MRLIKKTRRMIETETGNSQSGPRVWHRLIARCSGTLLGSGERIFSWYGSERRHLRPCRRWLPALDQGRGSLFGSEYPFLLYETWLPPSPDFRILLLETLVLLTDQEALAQISAIR